MDLQWKTNSLGMNINKDLYFLLTSQSFMKETFIDKKDEGMRSCQGGIQFDYGTLKRTYLIEGADWF